MLWTGTRDLAPTSPFGHREGLFGAGFLPEAFVQETSVRRSQKVSPGDKFAGDKSLIARWRPENRQGPFWPEPRAPQLAHWNRSATAGQVSGGP